MATAKLLPQLVEDQGVDLANKTVLLVASFSKLGNTKRLKETQFQTAAADPAMTKAQKKLLDSPELVAIGKVDGQLREYFRLNALPFPQPSTYLIPTDEVPKVLETIEKFERKRNKLIDKFVEVFPERKAETEKRLGPLFNERDYPTAEAVKTAFDFRYCFTNYGAPEQLKTISLEVFKKEQIKAQNTFRDASEEIMAVRREILLKMVNHLAEKLGEENGKQKIFRDTTVEKLQQFLNDFEGMNVVNDEEASRLVKQARKLLSGKSPDELRTTEGVRESVKKGMTKIAKELETLVENMPSRKMRGF